MTQWIAQPLGTAADAPVVVQLPFAARNAGECIATTATIGSSFPVVMVDDEFRGRANAPHQHRRTIRSRAGMKIQGQTGAVQSAARRLLDLASSAPSSGSDDTANADGDELSLSPVARGKQAARTAELLQWNAEPLEVADMRRDYDQKLAGLESRLQVEFAKAGIETSPPFQLQTDTEGKVRVAGDHPQKAQIEQLFADNPDLRDDFAEVNAKADFLRAADEAMAFQRAYAEDPEGAVKRFSYLFDNDRKPTFQLSVSGDKYDVGFQESRSTSVSRAAA